MGYDEDIALDPALHLWRPDPANDITWLRRNEPCRAHPPFTHPSPLQSSPTHTSNPCRCLNRLCMLLTSRHHPPRAASDDGHPPSRAPTCHALRWQHVYWPLPYSILFLYWRFDSIRYVLAHKKWNEAARLAGHWAAFLAIVPAGPLFLSVWYAPHSSSSQTHTPRHFAQPRPPIAHPLPTRGAERHARAKAFRRSFGHGNDSISARRHRPPPSCLPGCLD